MKKDYFPCREKKVMRKEERWNRPATCIPRKSLRHFLGVARTSIQLSVFPTPSAGKNPSFIEEANR